ncbi:MAG: hypothetical protein OS130_09980 [Thermodesulfobacteriota bacterium]|jgi:hypothetical protein|nr:MAG: hypothetical protein OS130_09980 [Thermodesulfobacteriota bacterium]
MGQKGMTINVRQGGQTLIPAPPEEQGTRSAARGSKNEDKKTSNLEPNKGGE